MRKLIETASSAFAAGSMLALALGFAVLSKPLWADEPLNAGQNCNGCFTGHDGAYCNPCDGPCKGTLDSACIDCGCVSNGGEACCPLTGQSPQGCYYGYYLTDQYIVCVR